MQVVQACVAVRARDLLFTLQVVVQLPFGRHRRRAAVARNHQCAAGVGVAAGLLPAFIVQVAAQQPGHKGVAGPQHVQHLYPHAGVQLHLFPVVGDVIFEHRAALRAALAHQRGRRGPAHVFQRRQRVGAAAGDMKFLFSADDQIEMVQHLLQFAGHLV